jgi:AhpD family alkylhydroperoxidase
MATVRLWTDDEVEKDPAVKAVFDDIRRVRGSEFVNNFWRALANDAANLKRTWAGLKVIMGGDGALDPLTRELIYIAVSAANSCSYCIHSHTAAAKQKGMTDAQHMHLLAIIGMASETNKSGQRHASAGRLRIPGRCMTNGRRLVGRVVQLPRTAGIGDELARCSRPGAGSHSR